MIKYKKKNLVMFLLLIVGLTLVCSLQTTLAAENVTINDKNIEGVSGGINATDNGGNLFLDSGTYNKKTDRDITISKNLTIRGNGSTETVIIDAQKSSRIFTIDNNAQVILTNITFQNGHDEKGGAIHNKGKLTIINCSFTNNTAKQDGGGAIANDKGSLSVSGSNFTGNTAQKNTKNDNKGGAIYNNGDMTVSGSSFTENEATYRWCNLQQK